MRQRRTGQPVECPCCGREAVIRLQTYRALCRMFSPEYERELHKLVSRTPEPAS